jgi:hypothetical protein
MIDWNYRILAKNGRFALCTILFTYIFCLRKCRIFSDTDISIINRILCVPPHTIRRRAATYLVYLERIHCLQARANHPRIALPAEVRPHLPTGVTQVEYPEKAEVPTLFVAVTLNV